MKRKPTITPRLSHREKLVNGPIFPAILHLALPMMIAHGLQSLFNLVDTFFVGKLGPDEVAAVGMSGVVMFVMMTLMIGLSTATRALVARAIGENDPEKAELWAGSSLIIAFVISIGVAIFGTTLAPQILSALGANQTVQDLGVQYIRIMFLGMMSMAFTFSIQGILYGSGDGKTPMYILLFATGLNIFLDPMLIMGYGPFPKLGVTGAALATVSARTMAMIIGLVVLFRGKNTFRLSLKHLKWNGEKLWRIIRIGFPAAIQPALANIAGLAMVRIIATFGTTAIAGHVIALRLNMMAMLPAFAFANANGAVVGQNLGAGLIERAKKATWITAFSLEAIFLVVGGLVFTFAPWIVSKFNSTPDVVKVGATGIRIIIMGYPVYAFGTAIWRALNGAGDTTPPVLTIAFSLFVIQIPLAILLSRIEQIGFRGIFISIPVAYLFQTIIFILYFKRERWTKVKFH